MIKNLSDEKIAILAKRKPNKYLHILYMRYRNYGYSIIESALKKTFYYSALAEEKDRLLIESIDECIKDFKEHKGSFKNLLSSVLSHKTYKLISKFSKDGLSDYVSIDSITINGDMLFADSESVGPTNPKKALDEQETKKIIATSYKPNSRKIKYVIDLKNKGYSYCEIASKTNKSPKAVRQLFYRIRKTINKKSKK